MEQTLRAQHREARRDGRVSALVRLWLDVIRDLVSTAPREHVAILWQDVGYALRALRRAPVFAVSAVLTLALGMSAMAGMFAVVNAMMFRPLAVDHPEQLISISNQAGLGHYVSYKDFQDYRAETSVLSDAIGYVPRIASLNVSGSAERITIQLVTDNYFSMLGVQPAAGRLIRPDEGRARGDAPVLVLSYDYWQSRFGGDPSLVGRSVRLGSQPFTIIGVSSSVVYRHGVAAACVRVCAGLDGRCVHELRASEVRVRGSLDALPFCAGAIEARRLARAGARGSRRSRRAPSARLSRIAQRRFAARDPRNTCSSESRTGRVPASGLDGSGWARWSAGADHQRERGQPADGARGQPQPRGRDAGRTGRTTRPAGATVPDRRHHAGCARWRRRNPARPARDDLAAQRRVWGIGGDRLRTRLESRSPRARRDVLHGDRGWCRGGTRAGIDGVPCRSRSPSHERCSRHSRPIGWQGEERACRGASRAVADAARQRWPVRSQSRPGPAN